MDFKHYGVVGMKWGVRRYQPYSVTGPRKNGKTGQEIGEAARANNHGYMNKDGTLTDKGREEIQKHIFSTTNSPERKERREEIKKKH